MPRFTTNLLIRDNRPDVFAAAGVTLHARSLNDAEFQRELATKLVEEAQEAATASAPDVLKELADVWEVMLAMATLHGHTAQDIIAQAEATRTKLGGFAKRVYSESIEAPEDHETTRYHRQFPQKYPEIQE